MKRRQTRDNTSMQQSKRGRRVQYVPVRKVIGGRSRNDIVSCYVIEFRRDIDNKHILGHLSHAMHAFIKTIKNYQQEHNALKFKLVLNAVFEKATDPEIVTEPAVVLHTENFEVYQATNILEELENAEEQVYIYIYLLYNYTCNNMLIIKYVDYKTYISFFSF